MKPIAFTPPWQTSTEASGDATAGDRSIPIIIAEDDPVSREFLSSLVNKWGFRSVITQDGHEAMAALRSEQGAAIALLDWMMPGMDGLEVCRRVRESQRKVYIILLTARGGTQNIVEGFQAGADDYLVKPYDKNELFARINVGLRILNLHSELADRIRELETIAAENAELKLKIPI
jgi:DNA-binding response OmpR family regulator